MITINNLSKVYSAGEVETHALENINLKVEMGEFVAVMGPSGCGKTTLLNLMGLLDTPSSGTMHFNHEEVSRYPEKKRAELRKSNIGFVFQNFNLIDELTVYENVELPLYYLEITSSERKKRTEAVLDRMKIAHRKNHFPQQLSGGQQQRTAVARAVAANPGLVLADEPTGNLDSVNGQEVMDLLAQLNEEGTTLVVVTHSPSYAEYGHRIVRLFDGHLVSENVDRL
ncbi:MAG: ABC transporter ATP-binding protein [Proteobacteria bacterium]|nr:ABC transporter ATP-binding protein [Pseudomonadota bacterium]